MQASSFSIDLEGALQMLRGSKHFKNTCSSDTSRFDMLPQGASFASIASPTVLYPNSDENDVTDFDRFADIPYVSSL